METLMKGGSRQANLIIASCLRKSALICGYFFLLTATTASAQHGGKAEPNRIEFKRGATSTTVIGVVRGDEEAEYVLSAKKGQRLTLKMTSVPVRSSLFELIGEDSDTLDFEYDADFTYTHMLPRTGDYFITVRRPTGSRGKSKYKLTVTIR